MPLFIQGIVIPDWLLTLLRLQWLVRWSICFYISTESRLGGGIADDKLPTRASHRLHQTLHEPRHQHLVQTPSTRKSRPVLILEPSRHRDLGVRDRSLPRRQPNDVRACPLQSIRMVQPPPLQPRQQRAREHFHPLEFLLVRRRNFDAAGFWHQPQGCFDSDRRWDVVVLHTDHHFLVHCQSGRFPDRRTDGVAHRKCRRSRQTERHFVRHDRGRIHHDVFQGRDSLKYDVIKHILFEARSFVILCRHVLFCGTTALTAHFVMISCVIPRNVSYCGTSI